MIVLYNIGIWLYVLGIRIYSLFNAKAKKWVAGRHDWRKRMLATLQPDEKRVWIHCSSVGEFEQARPLLEALKAQYPAYKMVVTFFSPSGYDACSKNSAIDYAFYLPQDTHRNAERLIAAIKPSLAVFVKYEFWYHYLHQLKKQRIPAILVSGAFRREQVFFKWYGGLFRSMLQCFDYFYLQDEQSKQLLSSLNIKNTVISGDTRYDRVATIAKDIQPIQAVEHFKAGNKILIAGSTWPGDEAVIKDFMGVLPKGWKLIIAPHEVDEQHVSYIRTLFGSEAVLYSELDAENTGSEKKVLIINNIGMLSRLYACGDISFVGGGFQSGGIHNVLEPAVFGLPVLIGPNYQKFVEARELVSHNYVFPVSNAAECTIHMQKLIGDDSYRQGISAGLWKFMEAHRGATTIIIDGIRAGNWLR